MRALHASLFLAATAFLSASALSQGIGDSASRARRARASDEAEAKPPATKSYTATDLLETRTTVPPANPKAKGQGAPLKDISTDGSAAAKISVPSGAGRVQPAPQRSHSTRLATRSRAQVGQATRGGQAWRQIRVSTPPGPVKTLQTVHMAQRRRLNA